MRPSDNRNRTNFHRKEYQRKPYEREPSYSSRQNYEREHWQSAGSYYRTYTGTTNTRYQNNFNEQVNTSINNRDYYRQESSSGHSSRQNEINKDESLLSNPRERKAKELLHSVLKQGGIRSKLIFLETVDNAVQTLQGAVDNSQVQMTVNTLNDSNFVMKIDEEEIIRGVFPNKQTAKNSLAEKALELLRKDCFYIIKKKVYEEISTKESQPSPAPESQKLFGGSKAFQMMLKMGWSGKGLGINEQGTQETLADTIDQNITRQGLGNSDVFKKVNKILEDYAGSTKITMLRFDPDFTSEERAHIHKIAAKFGLKSKSEGKGEQRRITVTKKLHRADLVFNLLINDLENTLYKLLIPSNFAHLWDK